MPSYSVSITSYLLHLFIFYELNDNKWEKNISTFVDDYYCCYYHFDSMQGRYCWLMLEAFAHTTHAYHAYPALCCNVDTRIRVYKKWNVCNLWNFDGRKWYFGSPLLILHIHFLCSAFFFTGPSLSTNSTQQTMPFHHICSDNRM